MMNFERFWAGTEASFQQFLLVLDQVVKKGWYDDDGDQPAKKDGESRLLTRQGSLAIVRSAGPLINGGNAYRNAYYGVTGYGEIREAFIQAARDPGVKVILHDIASGGGHVAGVGDTSDLIKRIDTSVKPVFSYTDSIMASAAYWLGSAGRRVFSSSLAEVGSIGVLAVHTEYTAMMERVGIKSTVFRSGPFKALGHPSEPLSDQAKEVIQAEVNHMDKLFSSKMAERRGMAYDAFVSKAGQGRVFIGQQAVEAGLADGVTTFDELASALEQSVKVEAARL